MSAPTFGPPRRNSMPLILWTVTAVLLAGTLGAHQKAAAQENSTSKERPVTVPAGAQPTGYVEVPPATEDALHYHDSGNVLWLVNTAWGILIPCLFLFTGLSARIRNWAQRLGRNWFFTVALYFLILWILFYVIDWPLNYFEGYVRPHHYDLSNQS